MFSYSYIYNDISHFYTSYLFVVEIVHDVTSKSRHKLYFILSSTGHFNDLLIVISFVGISLVSVNAFSAENTPSILFDSSGKLSTG